MGIKLFLGIFLPLLGVHGQEPLTRLALGINEPGVVERVYERSLSEGSVMLSLGTLPAQVELDSVVLREISDTPRIEVLSQHLERVACGDETDRKQCPILPTWALRVPEAGIYTLKLCYLVQDLEWNGVYNFLLAPDMDALRIQAAISIQNLTAEQYNQPQIVLKQRSGVQQVSRAGLPNVAAASPEFPGIYPIPRENIAFLEAFTATTLPILDTPPLPVRPFLYFNDERGIQSLYEGAIPFRNDVWWRIEIRNSEENGLGVALPTGSARIVQEMAEGALFLSAGDLMFTPSGQMLGINLRNETGVTVRRQFERSGRGDSRLQHTVTISSRLADTHEMRLRIHPGGMGEVPSVKVVDASDIYKVHDNGQIEFRIQLAPGAERIVTFATEVQS